MKNLYYVEGKYVVRLYFLGAWRRILVDDMIPVNEEKVPLLPRTTNNFELWPMLLSKALLKLCSLTWTDYYEIVDFHPVTCLTGNVITKLFNLCIYGIFGTMVYLCTYGRFKSAEIFKICKKYVKYLFN